MAGRQSTAARLNTLYVRASDSSPPEGAVSREAAADPSAYERANYIGNIVSYTSRFMREAMRV